MKILDSIIVTIVLRGIDDDHRQTDESASNPIKILRTQPEAADLWAHLDRIVADLNRAETANQRIQKQVMTRQQHRAQRLAVERKT
jgi:hypothetical protein